MKIRNKTKSIIQSCGGLLILVLSITLLYLIWCPDSQNDFVLKIIFTEAVLIFIVWIIDGVTESDELEL